MMYYSAEIPSPKKSDTCDRKKSKHGTGKVKYGEKKPFSYYDKC